MDATQLNKVRLEVPTPSGGTETVDIDMRFDNLPLDHTLALAGALGEEDFGRLLNGELFDRAVDALMWVKLCEQGHRIPWEQFEVSRG